MGIVDIKLVDEEQNKPQSARTTRSIINEMNPQECFVLGAFVALTLAIGSVTLEDNRLDERPELKKLRELGIRGGKTLISSTMTAVDHLTGTKDSDRGKILNASMEVIKLWNAWIEKNQSPLNAPETGV